MFKKNDKVYFGNGAMEFVGFVTKVEDNKIHVSGIETGCLLPFLIPVEIPVSERLFVISESEFAERTLNEPAFAGSMTKERYLQLQSELENLKSSHAKTDDVDFRIMEIGLLMEASPWMMCSDGSCGIKDSSDAIGRTKNRRHNRTLH